MNFFVLILFDFFLEYDFDDRIDEFNFLKLDEWHVIELYFEYEDGWYFECAKNTEQQVQPNLHTN